MRKDWPVNLGISALPNDAGPELPCKFPNRIPRGKVYTITEETKRWVFISAAAGPKFGANLESGGEPKGASERNVVRPRRRHSHRIFIL